MRLDHLLSKEHFSRRGFTQVNASRAETVSFPHVERQKLMGGTLTTITAYRGDHVLFGGGYIGALLGPEGTRNVFFQRR